MKKILIALDYEPAAQIIAETGYSLSKALKSEVILMHVVGNANYYSSLEYSPIMGFSGFTNVGMLESFDNAGLKEASQDFLNKTKQHLGDDAIQTFVSEGDSAESILEVAKEFDVGIIVLGSNTRRWLEKAFMGNITEKVLRHSRVPIFIVPAKK
ncbi:MAG: universal stress protein [Bacteroidota bacterium]|nr:universal stress protein [Bacteroidota bacterium]